MQFPPWSIDVVAGGGGPVCRSQCAGPSMQEPSVHDSDASVQLVVPTLLTKENICRSQLIKFKR